jgi:hypothetical protein
MASQAQIDANKRNAEKSCGPKTEAGKARARLNALKDGTHAKIVSPVLPHENPIELDERINQWINDLNPQNDVERELVTRAAKLAQQLDRAERCETARLAHRVSKAQLKATAQRMKEVGELGRRLLFNAGPRILSTSGPPWEDNPAAFLRGLEESAEGCRWLLDHWAGLRTLLDRDSGWTYGDMFRLVRLLGKYPVEAINDPALNAVFLAWDAVVPGWAERFWSECKRCKPRHDPGFSDFGRWREIADRPADAAQGVLFFYTLIDEQVARLEELLEVNEEIADDEASELADRASFDGSASAERLRRMQTARSRELRQTLELLIKLRKSEPARKTENEGKLAASGSKVKDSGNLATEPGTETGTLGRSATPTGSGEAEPGTSAKVRTRKQDKYRSAVALEMVMAGRLAE